MFIFTGLHLDNWRQFKLIPALAGLLLW